MLPAAGVPYRTALMTLARAAVRDARKSAESRVITCADTSVAVTI